MDKMPLVSYLILCYNHQTFIREAIISALHQDYDSLEIIISDDNSTDDSVSVIEDTIKDYQGPHKIITNFNTTNMGLIPHLNKLMNNFVHGDYIALAGGDDISFPNRVTQSVKDIIHYNLHCISYNGICIDCNGISLNRNIYAKTNGIDVFAMSDFIKDVNFNIHGASKMFDRMTFEYFGNFLDDCPTEDSTLNFRGLLLGEIGVSYVPILKYRTHDNNLSGTNSLLKIPYQLILKQYRKDLDVARNVSYKQKEMINKRLLKYEKINKILRSSFVELIISGDIFFVMINRCFSLKEKASIIKKSFGKI